MPLTTKQLTETVSILIRSSQKELEKKTDEGNKTADKYLNDIHRLLTTYFPLYNDDPKFIEFYIENTILHTACKLKLHGTLDLDFKKFVSELDEIVNQFMDRNHIKSSIYWFNFIQNLAKHIFMPFLSDNQVALEYFNEEITKNIKFINVFSQAISHFITTAKTETEAQAYKTQLIEHTLHIKQLEDLQRQIVAQIKKINPSAAPEVKQSTVDVAIFKESKMIDEVKKLLNEPKLAEAFAASKTYAPLLPGSKEFFDLYVTVSKKYFKNIFKTDFLATIVIDELDQVIKHFKNDKKRLADIFSDLGEFIHDKTSNKLLFKLFIKAMRQQFPDKLLQQYHLAIIAKKLETKLTAEEVKPSKNEKPKTETKADDTSKADKAKARIKAAEELAQQKKREKEERMMRHLMHIPKDVVPEPESKVTIVEKPNDVIAAKPKQQKISRRNAWKHKTTAAEDVVAIQPKPVSAPVPKGNWNSSRILSVLKSQPTEASVPIPAATPKQESQTAPAQPPIAPAATPAQNQSASLKTSQATQTDAKEETPVAEKKPKSSLNVHAAVYNPPAEIQPEIKAATPSAAASAQQVTHQQNATLVAQHAAPAVQYTQTQFVAPMQQQIPVQQMHPYYQHVSPEYVSAPIPMSVDPRMYYQPQAAMQPFQSGAGYTMHPYVLQAQVAELSQTVQQYQQAYHSLLFQTEQIQQLQQQQHQNLILLQQQQMHFLRKG